MTDIAPFLEVQHTGVQGIGEGDYDGTPDIPQDDQIAQEGDGAWEVQNRDAFNVFERASQSWLNGFATISTSPGGKRLVQRQQGRKSVTISVPTTFTLTTPPYTAETPAGCMIGPDQGQVTAFSGYQLNPGDSVTIYTEGEVWVGPLGGASSSCYVQYFVEINPPGGSIGSFNN